MISPAAAELIVRCREQVVTGIAHARRGDVVLAEAWFNAAAASLDALHALLDEPLQKPPLRKIALVVMPRDEELPAWMNKKVGDPDGAP